MGEQSLIRRSFLFIGIALTLFGCFIAALGIALPAWQVVELAEFNAIHEHGIFYDCIRSETYPLERLRQAETARQYQHKRDKDQRISRAHKSDFTEEEDFASSEQKKEDSPATTVSPFSTKKCIYKIDSASSSTWTMRMAIEDGDPAAREMLFTDFYHNTKQSYFSSFSQ
uniref:Uncharacterized protein n=1 Tax=Ditylenchus dipsaci TaxID=166011 RepID=A0A915EDM5_9BILA